MERTTASLICTMATLVLVGAASNAAGGSSPVVDTGQDRCYGTSGTVIACPDPGEQLAGQDAQHHGSAPRYADNGDGTVTDLVTGLMWQEAPTTGVTWRQAVDGAATTSTGGYTDWRLPSIRELYSLMDFTGVTGITEAASIPYLDTDVFDFAYGDTSAGDRFIDAQYCSSTRSVSTTMHGAETVFGVNFADGRIKGYPVEKPDGGAKTFHVRYVRGNPEYGIPDLVDNGDGTVTDRATGLMWSVADSGVAMTWQDALAWVEDRNAEAYLGHSDWRLPNAKELQSLVDYSRSPDTTGSAAIDPVFRVTSIVNEGGQADFPWYWSGTTHLDGMRPGVRAVYVAFGRALGWMESPPGSGGYELLDVHGAGAQRSDPKIGDAADYPYGHGPQGDVIRILNFVRPVRDAGSAAAADACLPADTNLCLAGDRFRVEVAWRTADGRSGLGSGLTLTDDTGAFWFFAPDNLELMVKVLDGRSVNGCFWVFYGALSDVEYALTVTDTSTGTTRSYRSEQGDMASMADTAAFPAGGP